MKRTDAKRVFASYLSEHGFRMTEQRQIILNEFMLREGHFTAEELTETVKKKDKSIGQATVYRLLKVLTGSGIAREVSLGDGITRYEHHLGHEHHDHLTCDICGKTVEIFDEQIELLQNKLAEKHGFTIGRHVMIIYGACSDCRKK